MTNMNNNTRGNRKAIMCIETGETFDSVTKAALHFGVSPSYMAKCAMNSKRTCKGMHFCVLELKNKENLIRHTHELTIQKKATVTSTGKCTSGSCKAVMCIDTGEIYNSATDAAEHNNTTPGNMSHACTGKQKTVNGKRFCYIQDINCHLDKIAEAIHKANAYDLIIEKENTYKELIANVDKHEQNVHVIELKLCAMQKQLEEANIALANAKQALADFN